MLLTHPQDKTPDELILTPRHGGPTPPNHNAVAFDDHPDQSEPVRHTESVRCHKKFINAISAGCSAPVCNILPSPSHS
jgi:hypothetical protein